MNLGRLIAALGILGLCTAHAYAQGTVTPYVINTNTYVKDANGNLISLTSAVLKAASGTVVGDVSAATVVPTGASSGIALSSLAASIQSDTTGLASEVNRAVLAEAFVTGDVSQALLTFYGGVQRGTLSRANDKLNVKDYGVVGGGIGDDTQGLMKAEAVAQAQLTQTGRISILFPAGRILTSQPFVLSVPVGGHVKIDGENGTTELMTTANTSAIRLIGQSYTASPPADGEIYVSLNGIRAVKANGTAAGSEAFEVIGNNPLPEVDSTDLRCSAPYGASKTPWHSCFHGVNVVRSDFNNLTMEDNGDNLGDPNQGIGLWIDATKGLYSVDNNVSKLQVVSGYAAVVLSNHVEGLKITQSLFLSNAYGVYAPGLTAAGAASDASTDWIDVSQTHVNDTIRGVYAVGANSVKVDDDVFYWSYNVGTTPTLDSTAVLPVDGSVLNPTGANGGLSYVGVDVINGSYAQVNNNEMQGFLAPYSNGIRLDSKTYGNSSAKGQGQYTVGGNTINSFQVMGVQIGSGITYGGTVGYNHFASDTNGNDVSDLSGLAVVGGNVGSNNKILDAGVQGGLWQTVLPGYFGGSNASIIASGLLTAGQGTYVLWNHSGGGGESDFVNQPGGGGVPGFNWYQASPSGVIGGAAMMTLSSSGLTLANGLTASTSAVTVASSGTNVVRGSVRSGGMSNHVTDKLTLASYGVLSSTPTTLTIDQAVESTANNIQSALGNIWASSVDISAHVSCTDYGISYWSGQVQAMYMSTNRGSPYTLIKSQVIYTAMSAGDGNNWVPAFVVSSLSGAAAPALTIKTTGGDANGVGCTADLSINENN